MTGRPPLPLEQRKRRPHGTNARYRWGEVGDDWRNGCRCRECKSAGVLFEKLRANRKARGIDPFVDNSEAREHLLWLESQGVGLRTVAEVTGLSRSALSLVRSGRRLVSRRETISAVLAVGTHHAAPGAVVDGSRTAGLIDELVALGHTKGAIAQALGCSTKALQVCRRGTVLRSTADKVAALHRELTASRDAQRQQAAERQADYRARRDEGRLNYRRGVS